MRAPPLSRGASRTVGRRDAGEDGSHSTPDAPDPALGAANKEGPDGDRALSVLDGR